MPLYVYIVLLFTSFGRLDMVEVRGPVNEDGEIWSIDQCLQARDDFMNTMPAHQFPVKSWRRIVTPCIEIQAMSLPRCE